MTMSRLSNVGLSRGVSLHARIHLDLGRMTSAACRF